MMRTKSVSDETIIAAVIQTGSVQKAAAALEITPRAIYDRLKDDDVAEMYQQAKADVIRGAVLAINQRLGDAVDTVATIMEDETVNPATRLQAAQTVINAATKLAERLNREEKPRNDDPFSVFL
jgi:uncharacterized membrane protein